MVTPSRPLERLKSARETRVIHAWWVETLEQLAALRCRFAPTLTGLIAQAIAEDLADNH